MTRLRNTSLTLLATAAALLVVAAWLNHLDD